MLWTLGLLYDKQIGIAKVKRMVWLHEKWIDNNVTSTFEQLAADWSWSNMKVVLVPSLGLRSFKGCTNFHHDAPGGTCLFEACRWMSSLYERWSVFGLSVLSEVKETVGARCMKATNCSTLQCLEQKDAYEFASDCNFYLHAAPWHDWEIRAQRHSLWLPES